MGGPHKKQGVTNDLFSTGCKERLDGSVRLISWVISLVFLSVVPCFRRVVFNITVKSSLPIERIADVNKFNRKRLFSMNKKFRLYQRSFLY